MQGRTSFAIASDGFVKSFGAIVSQWRILLMCYGSILQLFFISFIGALCTIPLSDLFSGQAALISFTLLIALLAYYLVSVAVGSAMAVFVERRRGNIVGLREMRMRMNGIIVRLTFRDQSGALQLAVAGVLSFSGYLAPNIFALFHGYGMAKGGLSLADPLWIVFAALAIVAGPYFSGLTALSFKNLMLLDVDANTAIRQAREELKLHAETYNVAMLYLVCFGVAYFIANQHFILHYIIPSEDDTLARQGIFFPIVLSSLFSMIGILLQALPYAWISEELASGAPSEPDAAADGAPAKPLMQKAYRLSVSVVLMVFMPVVIGCVLAAIAFLLPHVLHRPVQAKVPVSRPMIPVGDARAIAAVESAAGLSVLPLDYKAVSAKPKTLVIAHPDASKHFAVTIAIEPAKPKAVLRAKILPAALVPAGCLEIGGETVKTAKQKTRIHKFDCIDAQGTESVRAIAFASRGKRTVAIRAKGELGSYDARALAHIVKAAAQAPRKTRAAAPEAGPKVTVLTAIPAPPAAPELPPFSRFTALFNQAKRSVLRRDIGVTMHNLSVESCADTTLHARNNDKPTTISVINATTVPIEIFEVNARGEATPYANLPPSASLVIATFATHPWLFRHDGACATAVSARGAAGNLSFE